MHRHIHARRFASGKRASLACKQQPISLQSRAAEILLVASMYNSTTPTAPIWSEKRSQAQRADGKSFAKPGPQWAKLSRARGSQRPDLSPVGPQKRRSSAPGAVKARRGPKNGDWDKTRRTPPSRRSEACIALIVCFEEYYGTNRPKPRRHHFRAQSMGQGYFAKAQATQRSICRHNL